MVVDIVKEEVVYPLNRAKTEERRLGVVPS